MSVLQGKLLLATPGLEDPNFARSIILLVEHGRDGALGLILNRPMQLPLREALSAHPDGSEAPEASIACGLDDLLLHHGGPCQGPLMLLHDVPGAASSEVLPGLHFTASRNPRPSELGGLTGSTHPRCFTGYAGWGPQQLEQEILSGGWSVVEVDATTVLLGELPSWRQLRTAESRGRLLHGLPRTLIPLDPALN